MQTASQPALATQKVDLAADQHPLSLSILLHLVPGVILTLFYILLVPPFLKLGINNLITLNLLAVLVLVPVELFILYRAGKLKNGNLSLQGIVLNREKLPAWQLVLFSFIVFIWIALLSQLLTPMLDPLLQKHLFGWVPAWFPLTTDFQSMPHATLVITLAVSLVCTSWIGPVVEELYFRGYLLPRLSRLGNWAPVLNGVLFTIYHFFTPWAFVERVLMTVPMAWLVQKKRNLYITIIAHVLLNTIGILPALLAALLRKG